MSNLTQNTIGLNAIKELINNLPDYIDPAKAPIPSDAITALIDKGVIVPDGTDVRDLAALISAIETGGGDTDIEDSLIKRTITEYSNDRVETIGPYTFANCRSLTTVNFPVATLISNSAFYSCYSLTTISFPAAKEIGSYAFANCSSLTTASFSAVTEIGSSAFYSCQSLTTANFSAVTRIEDSAFYNCRSLTTISFPAAQKIGFYAFCHCSSLTTASFPAAISIYREAFAICYSLTTVSFPVATFISNSAFAYCSSLTTVSFPAMTLISNYAFRDCPSLTSFYLLGSYQCRLSNSNVFVGAGITSSTGTIYVPASLLTSYQTATNWAYFSTRFVAGD